MGLPGGGNEVERNIRPHVFLNHCPSSKGTRPPVGHRPTSKWCAEKVTESRSFGTPPFLSTGRWNPDKHLPTVWIPRCARISTWIGLKMEWLPVLDLKSLPTKLQFWPSCSCLCMHEYPKGQSHCLQNKHLACSLEGKPGDNCVYEMLHSTPFEDTGVMCGKTWTWVVGDQKLLRVEFQTWRRVKYGFLSHCCFGIGFCSQTPIWYMKKVTCIHKLIDYKIRSWGAKALCQFPQLLS